MRLPRLILLLAALSLAPGGAQTPQDTSLRLMHSTFRIAGPGGQATVFLLTVPGSAGERTILVTAAHVLRAIEGDTPLVSLRQQKAGGKWEPLPWPVRIRSAARPLWVEHPTADAAAMEVEVPEAVRRTLAPASLLADATVLERMLPGEPLQAIGFPRGLPFAFPVLRGGPLASPILPDQPVASFVVNLPVGPGDSGSPIYWRDTQLILGMISQSIVTGKGTPLELARILPAPVIRETIDRVAGRQP
ncbi:MAG: trypsin-like peptidase domain-containing protein [Bryobacterales bacterium]|nr:trypsin-like peptidase domain-containing protein [Bryobacterales bacterium]